MNNLHSFDTYDTIEPPLGTNFDNITHARRLELSATLAPNTQHKLFDANQQVAAATSDAAGQATWILDNVAIGAHHYSIMDATLGIPYLLDGVWGTA